jgi:glycine/D-amino acid oxidase-like deaminating enzyme
MARPDDGVAVLEASVVGEGSSGRSAGFLLGTACSGSAGAAERNALLSQAMASLRDLVRAHRIPCQLEPAGVYRCAATPAGVKRLDRHRADLEAAGLACERLDAAELESRLGTGYFRAGISAADCMLVQPAALIRGLADTLPENVRLFEETPALAIAREPRGWRVECPAGSVLARRLLLANNAFARELGVGLRSRLGVVYACAGLTAPLPEAVLAMLGAGPWGVLPAHRRGAALRRTSDGRLLGQALCGYEREQPVERVRKRLDDYLRRRFPQLPPDLCLERVWSGATGLTGNGAPLWGEIAPELLVSAGCNGGGVVKGTLLGTLLARKALGEAVPDVPRLFGAASWMPPEPVRRLRYLVISSLDRRALGREA